MSSDFVDTAVADPPPARTAPRRTAAPAAPRRSPAPNVPRRSAAPNVPRRAAAPNAPRRAAAGAAPWGVIASPRGWEVPRIDSDRLVALRDVWRALWLSRLIVWTTGVVAFAIAGFGPVRHVFDPPGVTRGFGWLGDALAAPVARWDAAWYLAIAHWGYRPALGAFSAPRDAFFPLYPLGLRAIAELGAPPILAGVLLSLGALALALYWLHRLTTLEATRLRVDSRAGRPAHLTAPEIARLAVLTCALAPMGVFLSAVYSESLYLALSVGAFLFARRGRWGHAAALAALAGATRSTGVLLVLPLAVLYLYGPREDRAPDRPGRARGRGRGRGRGGSSRNRRLQDSLWILLAPRYRLRSDALWALVIPAGLGLYMAYLALAGGDALAPFHAQAIWGRHFAGPLGAIWQGGVAGVRGAFHPGVAGGHNLELLCFLLAGLLALIGVLRSLPLAHGVYLLGALALPLSYPVASQPLMSLPRFLLVLFPLNIWLAVRLSERPALARATLLASALGLGFFTASFATWHWVA